MTALPTLYVAWDQVIMNYKHPFSFWLDGSPSKNESVKPADTPLTHLFTETSAGRVQKCQSGLRQSQNWQGQGPYGV
jgi:hypothetical protein